MQEAADCLGADCVPRYVEMKKTQDLDVAGILQQSTKAGYLSLTLQDTSISIYCLLHKDREEKKFGILIINCSIKSCL